MYCKHCGNKIKQGQKFCGKCGRQLPPNVTENADRSSLNSVSDEGGKDKKRPKNPLLIGVVAVVIAITAGVAMWRVASDASVEPQADNPTNISRELYYSQPDDAHVVTDESTGVEFVDNELVIYAAGDVDESRIAEIAAGHNGVIVGKATAAASYQVRFDEAQTYQQLCDLSEELEALDDVEAVSRNVALHLDADSETGDPAWSGEAKMTWGLRAINAPDAWDRVQADGSVHVGIMDSQFFVEHEDLSGTFAEVMPNYQTSFSAKNNEDHGGTHGTHVAGIVGARANSLGSVGVAHGCTMYGWSAIGGGEDKAGKEKATLSYGLEVGLTYLVAQCDCRVINMSLGCDDLQIKNSTNSEQFIPQERKQLQEDSRSMENAIRALVRAGYEDFLICKSAGNTGYEGGLADYDFLGYISADDVRSRIIIVGSVGRNSGNKPVVSGFSSGGKRVDIVAPGEEVYSTWYEYSTGLFGNENVTSAYEYSDGTSMATPMVTGAAALVISANPKLNGPQVKRILTDTAEQGGYAVDDLYFVGLLDAAAAVNEAEGHEADSAGDGAYAAYLKKVEEYQSKFGEGMIEAANNGNVRQMKGLCLVDLIDFDNDGDEELLLGYYDESQANYYASDNFADAQAYRAEIWGYENGTIGKLYESDFHWTNGGFAYLPVYHRSNDVAMYKIDYSTDSDNRSVVTNGIWTLKGDAFEEITTFSTYGMWGTGEVEYEVDGKKVDESVYKTHFDDVMGDYTTTSYWMPENDSSSLEASYWDTFNGPSKTLAITQATIAKLGGENGNDLRKVDVSASADASNKATFSEFNLDADKEKDIESLLTSLFGARIRTYFGDGPWYAYTKEGIDKVYYPLWAMNYMGLVPEYNIEQICEPGQEQEKIGSNPVNQRVAFSELSEYAEAFFDVDLSEADFNANDYPILDNGYLYSLQTNGSLPAGACFVDEAYSVGGDGYLVFFTFVTDSAAEVPYDFDVWVASGGTREEFKEQVDQSYRARLIEIAGRAVIESMGDGSYRLVSYSLGSNASKIESKAGLYTQEGQSFSDDWAPPSYSVGVVSQSDSEIEFWVERLGANASPIYVTNNIRVAYSEGPIPFRWSDNWGNSGTGTLVFNNDSVNVRMLETNTANGNRSSLQTVDEGLDLPKINDSAPQNPMT